jgi:YfiH family protein
VHVLERFEDSTGAAGYRSPLLRALGVPHGFTTRHGDAATKPRIGLVTARQVHGGHVHEVGAGPLPEPLVADGLVTERRDVQVGVSTADCVPLLIASADGRRVAAVHAGWRGLVAGVVSRALAALGSRAELAAVGPCISVARYEVGPEVAERFVAAGLGSAVSAAPGERPHVDLRAAAVLELERGGVRRIDVC